MRENDFDRASTNHCILSRYRLESCWQRLSLGYRYKDIAARLQIGVGSAHRIFKKFELTGDDLRDLVQEETSES